MKGPPEGCTFETFEDRLAFALDEAIREEELVITAAERRSLVQALKARISAMNSEDIVDASADSLVIFCRAVVFGARWKFEALTKFP